MTLFYALGLLGLLGIPILILIYIIKNQYTEQTITSTYIWNISERFLKKRLPINRLVGIISLLLQILAVLLISLLMAHPVLILPDSAYAYCYILDGSASMNYALDGGTRFDNAKSRISDMISSAADGSTYTLIYAGETSETIYKDITDKERAIETLNSLEASFSVTDEIKTMDLAQEYFSGNNYAITYLFTDKSYEQLKNVRLVNVTEGLPDVENYAVTDVNHTVTGTEIIITGRAVSYVTDTELTVELYFASDGPDGRVFELYDSMPCSAVSGDGTEFTFNCKMTDFRAYKVAIKEQDGLMQDNEVVVNNVKFENIARTLLISDGPFYVRAALASAGNIDPDIITPKKYAETVPSGYGLYIFDNCTPDEMPREGSVWFINPRSSVAGANFTYQGEAVPRRTAVYSKSTASAVRNMLLGVSRSEFELAKYVKCGVGGKFNTIITCDNNPMLFTGTNMYGNREVVFAFSLYDTAPFTLSADCSMLFANLLNYSFPQIIEDTVYYCGQSMQVNVVAGCDTVTVYTPKGNTIYLDTSSPVSEYTLGEAGQYRLVMTMKDGTDPREFNVFAAVPEEERPPQVTALDFSVEGLQLDGKFDGIYDNLIILFILLAVIAAADYGIYCYEQYQLR